MKINFLILVIAVFVLTNHLIWAEEEINPFVARANEETLTNVMDETIDEEFEGGFEEVDAEAEMMNTNAQWETENTSENPSKN